MVEQVGYYGVGGEGFGHEGDGAGYIFCKIVSLKVLFCL